MNLIRQIGFTRVLSAFGSPEQYSRYVQRGEHYVYTGKLSVTAVK